MKLANNVEMLEVQNGELGAIYPVLVWDDKDLVLIDTGMPMETDAMRAAVKAAGRELEDVTKVILTHQDLDHIGSAKALAEMGAELIAHEEEAPYIQGDKASVRLTDMEARLDGMGEDERAFYERAKAGAPYFYAPIARTVKDGDVLDVAGGIKLIHTPGHMPGHLAALLLESNILVAGDAANIEGGKLTGANPQHTRDMESAGRSLQKIKDANASAIVCYHGGLLTL